MTEEWEAWLAGCLHEDEQAARAAMAQALADIEAKRNILALHAGGVSYPCECGRCNETLPCETVRWLTVRFADRPGFKPGWAPQT